MTTIRHADGRFLIRESPLQWGSLRQAKAFYSVPLQDAIDKAAQIRAAGVEVYAASDNGNIQDPNYVAPPEAKTDLTVRWPDKWQVEVEELGPSRYAVRFVDEFNQQRTVLGRNPQEAVDRLAMQALTDTPTRNFLQSITPQPVAPVAPAPPVVEGPRKFVRAGDRTITDEERAEMDATRQKATAPKTPPAEIEYLWYYDNSPANAVRKRVETDPGFAAWAKQAGIFDMRSNVNAR